MGAAWYVFYPILVLWLAMLVIGCGIALSAISFFFFSHNVKIIAWIARLVWILPVVLFGFGMFGIGWVVYHAKNGVSSKDVYILFLTVCLYWRTLKMSESPLAHFANASWPLLRFGPPKLQRRREGKHILAAKNSQMRSAFGNSDRTISLAGSIITSPGLILGLVVEWMLTRYQRRIKASLDGM